MKHKWPIAVGVFALLAVLYILPYTNNSSSLIIDEQEYKSNAISVDYEDLVREPYNYKGQILAVSVEIAQVMADNSYRCYENNYDKEWYISYDLPDNTPRIIKDDQVTFYGEFVGLTKVTRALTGVKEEVPKLKATYHE